MILPEGRKTLAPTCKFFLITIFRNNRGTSIKKRPFLKRGIFLEGEIKKFGALGVAPSSQDPQPCIITVILRPEGKLLFGFSHCLNALCAEKYPFPGKFFIFLFVYFRGN